MRIDIKVTLRVIVRFKLACLKLFLLLTSTQVLAQSSIDDLFNMSLEDLMKIKVVGSTKTPETLSSVPASVSVYSGDEIELMGIQTLEELMNFVPAFSSARSGDSGYRNIPSVRSKRSQAMGKEVLILIDGQRLNSDFSGGVSTFNNQIPVGNFERVEFIRGPGSALYGSNAFMGVINIITTKDKNDLSLAIGENGSINTYLNYTYNSGDFRISTFVTSNSTNGERYSGLSSFSHFGNVNSFSTKDPFKRDEIYLSVDYKRFYFAGSLRQTKASDFYTLAAVNDSVNNQEIGAGFVRLEYDGSRQSIFNTKVSAGYREENSDLDFTISPTGIFLPDSNDASTFLTNLAGFEYDLKVDNRVNFDNGGVVLFGAEYRRAKTQNLSALVNGFPGAYFGAFTSLENVQGSALTSENYRTIYGLYGQYQKDLTKNISMTAGIRYDNYSDFGTALSPRIGLVYDNFSGRIFKLLYAEAFRAPSREENDLQAQGVLVGNSLLEPEVAETLEAIWIEKIVDHTFTLTLFSTKIEDAISDVTNGVTGQRTVQNLTEDFTGFEVEVLSDISDNMFLRSSVSIVTQKEDQMFRNPTKTGSLVFNWYKNKWNANFRAYYRGKTENDFAGIRTELDDYIEVSSKIMYKLNEKTKIFLLAKNLMDEDYLTSFEGVNNRDGVPGRGRLIYAGINYRF